MTEFHRPIKPTGRLHLKPGRYVELDAPRITPRRDGLIDYELYLNLSYRLHDPHKAGKVRVKLVRSAWRGKPEDPTGYQGFWLMPGWDNLLITHTPWEIAEDGRPVWFEIRIDGADGTVGTRYQKAILR